MEGVRIPLRSTLPVHRLLVLLAVLFLSAGEAAAQETREVVIENAATGTGGVEEGERVQRLSGDVRLRQGDTRLRAREVVRYLDREEILFSGDVLIIDEGDSLRADRVRYDTRRKIGRARGSVRLSDGEVVVSAPSGLYFIDEERAEFEEGVTLVDSASVLRSERGAYWTEEKRAEFYQHVRLTQDRTALEADSVTFFRDTEVSVARGRVFIERFGEGGDEGVAAADTTTRTLLFGAYAYNDNQRSYSRIEGAPLLVQLRADSTGAPSDTLLVRSAVLETTRADSLQRLVARDSVQVWQRDLAAVADSLIYDRVTREAAPTTEEIRLFRSPMAWFEQSQVSGDTLRIKARDGSVDSLFVRGSAFVVQEDTLLGRPRQLKGQTMVARFEQDSLRVLRAEPNAEAIYFKGDESGALEGALRASSDYFIFWFAAGELRRVKGGPGAEGTYHQSAESIPEPFQLEGFTWEPERRPRKEGLLRGAEVGERLVPYVAAAGRSARAPNQR